MGVVETIGIDKFPQQSESVGKKIKVCFNYDTSRYLEALIIRDDIGEPGVTLLLLEDGRVIDATECQYQFPSPGQKVNDVKNDFKNYFESTL